MLDTLLKLSRGEVLGVWYTLVFLTAAPLTAQVDLPFVTTWKTDNPGSSSATSITIPTAGDGYDYEVDWNNDGIYDDTGVSGNITHDFGIPGTYTIRIRGAFPRIHFAGGGDAQKLTKILNWGSINWKSMEGAFRGCSNLQLFALDAPDLSAVTSMRDMFRDCSRINWHVNHWQTGSVTNMHGLFRGANSFDHPLNDWNVARVTDFGEMFMDAHSFDQSLRDWDVSSAQNMTRMFAFASNFNNNVGYWDTDQVRNMSAMFQAARQFDQNLEKWNTSSVTNMSRMFEDASMFNGKLGKWDVSSVTNMARMFYAAKAFDQPIGNWNTGQVTTMQDMFRYTIVFDQPIGGWDTRSVTDISSMFYSAKGFNQDLSGWDVSQVRSMKSTFAWATRFNHDLSSWDVSNVTDMSGLFWGTSYDQDISAWNVGRVTDMTDLFARGKLSQEYYDRLLVAWANQSVQPNVSLNAGATNFCAGAKARQTLIKQYGWTIEDGGAADEPPTPVCRDITVYLGPDGSVTIKADTLNGGSYDACFQPELTFRASQTTFTCEDIGTVDVTLTVEDADGNQESCLATVTVEDGPVKIYGAPANIEVQADSDGCTATATWTEPYTNCRSTLSSTHQPGDRFPLGATVVTYMATNGDGTPVVSSFVVTVTTDLQVSELDITPATCEAATDGGAALKIKGGHAPYTFDWNTDGTGDFDDTQDVNDLSVGEHRVVVKNAIGCTVVTPMEVTARPVVFTSSPSDREVTTNTDDCRAVVNWAAPTVSCDAGTMTSNYSSGDTFPVGSTLIIYTFEDDHGTRIQTDFTVTVTSNLRVVIEDIVPPSCVGTEDGEVLVGGTGGIAPYAFDWNFDGTGDYDDTDAPDFLPAGEHLVRVMDSTGCVAEGMVRLIEPAPLSLQAEVVASETGAQTIDLTVSGGAAPYRHEWTGIGISSEVTDEDITVAANGMFLVTVTDQNGCIATTQAEAAGLSEKCSNMNFDVFPNPTTGTFAVAFEECAYPVPITVYDSFGRLVVETSSTDLSTDLDFGTLRRGLYYIRVDGKYEVVSRTVMVQ